MLYQLTGRIISMDANLTRGVKNLLGNPKKAILKLSIPMMIAMLVQAMYNLVDAIWVSGLGTDALAAVGLFFPILMTMMALSNGIGIGGSSAISRRIGEKNKKVADNTAVHTLFMGLLVGLAVSLPFLPFLKNIFLSLGAKGKVAEMSTDYARILFAGAIFVFFANIANAILRGEGDTKRAMYAIIVGSILNIVLDPIYIYVLGMGVVGAAWATFTSMLISAALFFYWLLIKRDTYIDIVFKNFHPDGKIIKEILRVGIPASLAQLSMSISMFFLNLVVINVGGTDGVAVFTTGWRIFSLGTIPLLGMAIAVTSVTGAAYGAKNAKKLNTAYMYAIKVGMVIELVVSLITFFFAPQITLAFTYSREAKRIADDLVTFLRWMAINYPTVPLGMLSSAMFQGVGKGETALFITITRTIILSVFLAYLFGIVLNLNLIGVWWGIIIGNTLGAFIGFSIGKLTIRKYRMEFKLITAENPGKKDI